MLYCCTVPFSNLSQPEIGTLVETTYEQASKFQVEATCLRKDP